MNKINSNVLFIKLAKINSTEILFRQLMEGGLHPEYYVIVKAEILRRINKLN